MLASIFGDRPVTTERENNQGKLFRVTLCLFKSLASVWEKEYTI